MIYGYARVSTPKQSIERQIRNINNKYGNIEIYKESFTGTTMDRPAWKRLVKKLESGDVIVFDSVSRMARTADEGVATYFELYDKGIYLEFLKEPHIDTSVYSENMNDKIALTGTDEDEIFKGLNNYFRKLAARQIRIVFEQAEKEVKDLQNRTSEGIKTARNKGKQIGQKEGAKLHVKKAAPAKEIISKHSKSFGGVLNDTECMKVAGISRATYYKYKLEIEAEKINEYKNGLLLQTGTENGVNK